MAWLVSPDDAEDSGGAKFTACWKSWTGTKTVPFSSRTEAIEEAAKHDGWVEDDRGRTIYEVW